MRIQLLKRKLMDILINNEDSSESEGKSVLVKPYKPYKPYLNVILTKKGIEKISKKGKNVYDLPLTDLREPPRISKLYTIGDLVHFIDRHQYIKNAIEHHYT